MKEKELTRKICLTAVWAVQFLDFSTFQPGPDGNENLSDNEIGQIPLPWLGVCGGAVYWSGPTWWSFMMLLLALVPRGRPATMTMMSPGLARPILLTVASACPTISTAWL